jgi:hypothetical protein
MYKLILIISLFFIGCANYPVNGTICDKIKKDPTDPIPPECKVYSIEKAAEASENKQELMDAEDSIEFEIDEK